MSKVLKKTIDFNLDHQNDIKFIQGFSQKILACYTSHIALCQSCMKTNNLFGKLINIIYLSTDYVNKKCLRSLKEAI